MTVPQSHSAERPPGLRKKLSWISVLYFAQGFPFGISYKVWPVFFREHGMSLTDLGSLALLRLPYTLKPAWAPFVDRFGSRQSWIAACEFGLAAAILMLSFMDPADTTLALWAVLIGFMLFSATQDLAIDAYAVDVASPQDRGHINGTRVAAYRAAMLAGGGLLLALSDILWIKWQGVWWLSAGLCGLLGVLALLSPRVTREKQVRIEVGGTSRQLIAYRTSLIALAVLTLVMGWRAGWPTVWRILSVLAGTLAMVSFLSPNMLQWAFKREMAPILGFGMLYKLGDSALGQMVEPFWLDHAMTKTEIGLISNTAGSFLTILGAIAGGFIVSKQGLFKALLWLGLAQMVSNLGYVAVAALDLPRGSAALGNLSIGPFQGAIYLASLIESFTQGLGTTAFLSFLMSMCDKAHAATQFAMLTAAFSLTRDIAGFFSGMGVDAMGYAPYFGLTALIAVPGLLILPFLKGRIREREGPAPLPS